MKHQDHIYRGKVESERDMMDWLVDIAFEPSEQVRLWLPEAMEVVRWAAEITMGWVPKLSTVGVAYALGRTSFDRDRRTPTRRIQYACAPSAKLFGPPEAWYRNPWRAPAL